eukprot:TRINITY_DN11647_c0_g1_i1.p1 TRINITY_DN11647_c0_g1~~TRINITY_DN11647_c0_g1_i1.p1  ORF type:complete len:316 (+),score=184.69 TRINITY_DN11647_c0_g1_i1:82-1029(+)
MSTFDNVSAATKLRREQMDVQTELDQKRAEYRERMDRVREREQQLAKRRQELQDKLVRFYKFIQENEIKKNRADKKAQAEMKAKEEKHQIIVQLNEESRGLEQDKQEIKDRLQRYQKYQAYLEAVLQDNEEYSDPNDIISRWKTLDNNHKELQARKYYLEHEMERERTILQKKKENKATEILDATNALANKGKQLEQLHLEVGRAQDEIEFEIEKKLETTKLIGQVKMATQNLYDRCYDSFQVYRPIRRHKAGENAGGDEILLQLQFIGECLGDYIFVRDRYKEEQKNKKAQAQAVTTRPALPPQKTKKEKGEGE